MSDTLCGLWIDDAGKVHGCYATATGGREERTEDFRPFAWLGAEAPHEGVQFERLKGECTFNWLAHAESLAAFEAGADMIVIGNALEKDPDLLIEISDKVYEWNQSVETGK